MEVLAHLQEHFAGLDPKLGTVLRLRHGEGANRVDLPLDGGNDTVRASTPWDVEPDGRLKVRHGDSFIMFVTWDRDGRVRSESIQPFGAARSEEHTSELQSLMRNSYAVFCLKKKKN